ncbi:MAG: ABC transporter permease subunit [Gammaproteobacteria bacterium]|jgi:sodium transport system permease protein|nr:ABC transporter permease subunit [Gammaproteobacteria bacterium]
MNGLLTVFKKEVRENIRDRRALFNSLLLGPLLFPLLFVGMMWFLESAEKERAEKTLELPVIGAQYAPSLIRFLEQQGTVILPAPENPEEMVLNQEVPAVLRILPEYPEKWEEGLPAPLEVISDPSRQESNAPIRKIKLLLMGYGQQIGSLRLQLRGVSPQLAAPVMVKDVDLSTAKSRAILAVIFLPYVLMITAFTGATHLAMDTTAGEKERKSLEPLLINPVPRWQIMSGKMITTTVFAMASLALTLVSFRIILPYMPVGAFGMDLTLGLETLLKILLVISPVAILAAALLTLLASFAKSYREAQSYMGLVILIPMIPSLIFMANPIKAEGWMMSIPLFSQNILIGEIIRDESVAISWYAMSIASTLVLGLALAVMAATLYNRPRLIFSGS